MIRQHQRAEQLVTGYRKIAYLLICSNTMLKLSLVVLYALFPLANLNSAKAPSILFYLTAVTALAFLSMQRFAGAGAVTARYKPLVISYSILFLAAVVSSIAYGKWAGANSEGALRFFGGLWLLLLALPHINPRLLRHFVWGVYAAGLVSSIIVFKLSWPTFIRPDTPFHNAVTYGNFMLILSVITAFSIKWSLTPWTHIERIFKVLTTIVIFGGFMLTQTRSGWVAMPLFIFLGAMLYTPSRQRWRTLAVTVVGVVLAAGVFMSSDALKTRAVVAYNEVMECQGEGKTTISSVCVRLQLWRASIDMFQQHPLVGIGDGGKFADRMKTDSYPKGLVSEFVVTEYFGEPHNDLLFMLAVFGLPGFLGLLFIYLVPTWYFAKRLLSDISPEARAAAAMGVALCLGFAIFGITELMFRRMHTIGFYTMFVALFMVLSDPEQERIT